MITRPDPQQILDGVRWELRDKLGPEVHSDTARVALEMIDNVLHNLGVRALHEIAWMREEADAVVATAEAALPRFTEPSRAVVAAALDEHHAGRVVSLHYADVQADYSRASEVLSCCLEAAVGADDHELRAAFDDLLRERLAHEVEIMGAWGFVGRG